MGVCNCSMFCCTLLYVHSSIAIILMGKRELIALLNLSSWCLLMVERLFLEVPRGSLQFVIVVFPDHTHLLLFQLLGYMNFASRVILAGRAFVSYLLSLASSVSELYHYVHLNSECRHDLYMWIEFLTNWNGVSLFYERDFTDSFDIQLYTDAASTAGFSVVYKTHWISEKWPSKMPTILDNLASMAFIELYPIVAAYIFGKEWKTKKIMFVCDNQSVVSILCKGRSKCPHIMKLMRTLTWLALVNNFNFSSIYIESRKMFTLIICHIFRRRNSRDYGQTQTHKPPSAPSQRSCYGISKHCEHSFN